MERYNYCYHAKPENLIDVVADGEKMDYCAIFGATDKEQCRKCKRFLLFVGDPEKGYPDEVYQKLNYDPEKEEQGEAAE